VEDKRRNFEKDWAPNNIRASDFHCIVLYPKYVPKEKIKQIC